MDNLSIQEILEATGGQLLSGEAQGRVRSFSTDSRTLKPGDLFIALQGKNHDGHAFIPDALGKGAVGAIVSKPVSRPVDSKPLLILVRDTLEALGAIASCWRAHHPIPLVAVTGTNGKTTTKDMIGSVLGQVRRVLCSPGNFNNLVGLPLSLLQLREDHQAAVVELGMSAPGEIRRLSQISRPDLGVITNVGPAHLEFLRSVEAIAEAKAELLPFLERGFTILNQDDPYLNALFPQVRGQLLTFGLNRRADLWAEELQAQGTMGTSFILRRGREGVPVLLPALGIYNIYNALAAAAVGWAMGIDLEAIAEGLEQTPLSPMRMEQIQLACGARVLNDAYNANPASMKAALEAFFEIRNGGRAILLLADMLELGPEAEAAHRHVGELVARLHPDLLITLGELSRGIDEGAIAGGIDPEKVHHFKDYKEARSFLAAELGPDAWVFLKGSRGMCLERVLEGLEAINPNKNLSGGPG
ncbi:MAG: UDP-N-acetylmuramoyl-tripeptide--D-alanyl-D-alanine ligase [candidate division NC10 bacterium]|nr:UDP-N-acetylmuramoyl-tripeptide--D-alanyl-D-alanine ligase [candidate division NC10 bacterium]